VATTDQKRRTIRPPLRKYKLFRDVVVLDEHHLPASGEEPEVRVGPEELERIAANANRRAERTNDWTPLVVGHTRRGGPELPVVGYAANFRVKPFVNEHGRVVQAIYTDQYLDDADGEADKLARQYPRRSVELWTNRLQIDPICLLGGTSPERDLGVLVKYARDPRTGDVIDRRVRLPAPRGGTQRRQERTMAEKDDDDEAPKKKKAPPFTKADDEPDDEPEPDDDWDDEAEPPEGEEPEPHEGGGMPEMGKKVGDLTVGELFSLWSETAPMRFLQELMQHADGLGGPGMGDEFGPPPAGAPGAGPPPGGPEYGPPPPGAPGEEARGFHEPGPTRYEEGMGSPAADNTYLPEHYARDGRPYGRDYDGYRGYEPFDYGYQPPSFLEAPAVDPIQYEREGDVAKLSRELADLRKKQQAQGKRVAALETENEAVKKTNRILVRTDDARHFAREQVLAIEDQKLVDLMGRMSVFDMDDEKYAEWKEWLTGTIDRRLPNNGQRVDYSRQAPRAGQASALDAPVTSEAEAAAVTQLAVSRRISWDQAKVEHRRIKAGGGGG
jgi:hypothetical protein